MGFPGKDTGVGCHFLLQGIFLTQRSNLSLLHWQEPLSYQGSHINSINPIKSLKDKTIPGCNTKTTKKGKYLRITEMCLKWLCLEVKHKNKKENIEFFDTKNHIVVIKTNQFVNTCYRVSNSGSTVESFFKAIYDRVMRNAGFQKVSTYRAFSNAFNIS